MILLILKINNIFLTMSKTYIYNSFQTKHELANQWAKWLESNLDKWSLFTLTVVFNSGGISPNPTKWESEYKTKVLNKIKRRLEPNKNNQINAIPFDEFYFYEKNEASIHKLTGSRKPHHIHAIIPIKNEQLYRFWDSDNNCLNQKINKDIKSIDSVQSILIERITPNMTINWINYIAKGKAII